MQKRGEGRLILSLVFECVCLKLVMRLTLKILLQRMLVLWGFFFVSPLRETHCGIGPRCRPSGNTAK